MASKSKDKKAKSAKSAVPDDGEVRMKIQITLENGDEYVGQVNDEGLPDDKDGKLTFVNRPEGVFRGSFVNGKRHGPGKRTNKDGSWYNGDYDNDKPHGEGAY